MHIVCRIRQTENVQGEVPTEERREMASHGGRARLLY